MKERKRYWNLYITSLGSFFTDISTEMIYPLIPIFLTKTLGAATGIVGLIEGIAESTAALTKYFSGNISDRIRKRKPVAIAGYSFSVIGKLILYFAFSWPLVLLARFIDRLGKGIRTAPRDALISESVSPSERGRAFGFHRAADTLGAGLGVLFAYFIVRSQRFDTSIRDIFLISAIPAVLGVIVLLLLVETKKDDIRNLRKIDFKGFSLPLKIFLLITFGFSLGNSSNQFLILRAEGFNIGILNVLLLYLLYNITYAIFSYPAGYFSDVIGRRRVLVLGYLLYSSVYMLSAFAKSALYMLIAFFLYGLYSAFTEGIERAVVSDFSRAEERATALGAHSMLTGIGLFPASFAAGLLWDKFGAEAPFIFGAVTSFISAVAMWIFLYKYEHGGMKNAA
jgi:MFS family permease